MVAQTHNPPGSSINWIRRAQWLAVFTIAYNLVEGLVAIYFGVEEASWALLGFGMDSFIEVGSAVLVLWRFNGSVGLGAGLDLQREKTATAGIGTLFVILALSTLGGATHQLVTQSHPHTTMPGLVISALSLTFMFALWRAKLKAAEELNSKVVASDAACSLACFKLSLILFGGSLIFMLLPDLWWVDASAAVVLALLIGAEGWETIQATRHPDFQGGCGCGSSCEPGDSP